MITFKLFATDAAYPASYHLNSTLNFLEVTLGDETKLYRVDERSTHKCYMKIMEALELREIKEQEPK
jgi:hypothetical protein